MVTAPVFIIVMIIFKSVLGNSTWQAARADRRCEQAACRKQAARPEQGAYREQGA
jgi:hypothetical protein